jgi:hypothetical protein
MTATETEIDDTRMRNPSIWRREKERFGLSSQTLASRSPSFSCRSIIDFGTQNRMRHFDAGQMIGPQSDTSKEFCSPVGFFPFRIAASKRTRRPSWRASIDI